MLHMQQHSTTMNLAAEGSLSFFLNIVLSLRVISRRDPILERLWDCFLRRFDKFPHETLSWGEIGVRRDWILILERKRLMFWHIVSPFGWIQLSHLDCNSLTRELKQTQPQTRHGIFSLVVHAEILSNRFKITGSQIDAPTIILGNIYVGFIPSRTQIETRGRSMKTGHRLWWQQGGYRKLRISTHKQEFSERPPPRRTNPSPTIYTVFT